MRYLFLALIVTLSSGALAQTPDKVVQSFTDALNKKDLESAAKLVKGGTVAPQLKDALAKAKEWPTFTITKISSKLTGTTAVVSYHLDITGVQPPQSEDESLTLVQSGGDWLIQPPEAPSQGQIMPMLAKLLSGANGFGRVADTQQKTLGAHAESLSNIKQLALGLIMFSNDNDDKLKLTAADWKTKVNVYVKNDKIFTAPEDAKGTISYSVNSKLMGVDLTNVVSPAKTVLVYEGKDGHLTFRDDGKAAVAFADGHAQRITKEEAKSLLWAANGKS